MTALSKPLAEQLRPTCLQAVVGQTHLLAPGKPLARVFETGVIHSMVLWGPPGVGKTTLAKLLCQAVQADFLLISAVLGGVKEIREALEQARLARQAGRKTVVFVDEVHRFNKAQQDAFLPHVESGLITFIGATTENPSFEVIGALLSRAAVYVLKPLSEAELAVLLERARQAVLPHASIEEKALQALIQFSQGDARKLLNSLEQLLLSVQSDGVSTIDAVRVAESLAAPVARFDKRGELFFDQISALHKAVRGSHPDAALYWLCCMLEGGADPRYLLRRVVRMAIEDIGLADPRALEMALHASEAYERLGSPEGELALSQAVVFLACAAKSNASYVAYNRAREWVRKAGSKPVPLHLRNAPTPLMKSLGYGKAYRYAHDEVEAYAAGESYLPEGMEEPRWYQPSDRGLEIKIREKLAALRALDEAARSKD